MIEHNPKDILSHDSLLREMPPVLRARGFRLYLEGGRRVVDLWQYGGAALLGHTPSAASREVKSSVERGLFTPMPHFTEGRFIKALSRLFVDKEIKVYEDAVSLRQALNTTGVSVVDPALASCAPLTPSPQTLVLWRPFLSAEYTGVLLPVLPSPLAPKVLVFNKEESRAFPPSDIIAPFMLAPATRAIYDLIASPERGSPCFPRIEAALSNSLWRRQGIYCSLATLLAARDYAALFHRFLESGFLLPPTQNAPLILPGTLSPGEEAQLAALLRAN
jgi:hypothetical protein